MLNANKTVEKLKAHGIKAEWRSSYSGRGMFGETTQAVVLLRSEESAACHLCPELKKTRWDDLGKNSVIRY